ncbi:MAG: T9SS type A sorting domain-containing protein [Saprospiraceae bacterium]|nr:T9SS type A sorting domain-containing protein [Saprospiraceae bacterium]
MKRVFLLLSLMIGFLCGAQANSTIDFCATPAMTGNTYCTGGEDCSDCLADEGTFQWMQFGPCYQYGFRLSEIPTLGCSGYYLNYVWTINGLPAPAGFSPTSRLINFTANGTYTVCITIQIIPTGSTEPCHSYDFCQTVEINCFPCDLLDCDSVIITKIDSNHVTFTIPPTDCETCENPYYTISWKRKVDDTWNGGGYSIVGNEVDLYFLEPCTEYEIRIEMSCDGEEGDIITSCIFEFMTTGCDNGCQTWLDCKFVDTVYVLDDFMAFEFQPIEKCPNCPNPYYNIGWREYLSGDPWNYGGTTVAPTFGTGTIFSLDPCTSYEFIIELKCPDTTITDYEWLTPTVAECIFSYFTTDCVLPFAAPDLPAAPASFTRMMAFPNPAVGEVNLLILSDKQAEGMVHIYNSTGALVKQLSAQTNMTLEVSLENLAPGVYHYSFTGETDANIRMAGKFSIMK